MERAVVDGFAGAAAPCDALIAGGVDDVGLAVELTQVHIAVVGVEVPKLHLQLVVGELHTRLGGQVRTARGEERVVKADFPCAEVGGAVDVRGEPPARQLLEADHVIIAVGIVQSRAGVVAVLGVALLKGQQLPALQVG